MNKNQNNKNNDNNNKDNNKNKNKKNVLDTVMALGAIGACGVSIVKSIGNRVYNNNGFGMPNVFGGVFDILKNIDNAFLFCQ